MRGVLLFILCSCIFVVRDVCGLAEQGRWKGVLNLTDPYFGVYKSVFKGAQVYIRVQCAGLAGPDEDQDVRINWQLRETPCWEDYWKVDLLSPDQKLKAWQILYETGAKSVDSPASDFQDHLFFQPAEDYVHRCDNTIHLPEFAENCTALSEQRTAKKGAVVARSISYQECLTESATSVVGTKPIFTIPKDGVFLLIVKAESLNTKDFKMEAVVQIKNEYGYLSATEYPLLLFYGCSCILYSIYGVVWLGLSFLNWRDLIRLQFWIGGVIFLGMIEMAVFYAEYYSINSTGISVTGAVLVAEVISCAKRTLARVLVIIVSIGYGIVKPRLGSTFHRLVVVATLYFGLASFESCLRILHPVNGPSNRALMAGIPLSVLDAGIFYWIFHSLMTTTRTLRIRRNLVKLTLYRHFTNTLTFSVVSSVFFMIWSIRYLKTATCITDWKEIWIDEAYWHALFSLILLVIMILWRPSNNNQRFSFSPLLDAGDDDEEEDLVVNVAFGGNMKIRSSKPVSNNGKMYRNQNVEDELRWVEENVPADFMDGDLPALDSEEELVSSKFELSKMQ